MYEKEKIIISISNYSLDENRKGLIDFIKQNLEILKNNNFKLIIAGKDSEKIDFHLPFHLDIKCLGIINQKVERDLYQKSIMYLVASSNRAGYKTRISTALSNGLIPILHGKGALVNKEDTFFFLDSSKLKNFSNSKKYKNYYLNHLAKNYDDLRNKQIKRYKKFLLNNF